MERKESKTKAGAEKQELVGVSDLTLDFLLSSKILMSGSRAQHHESGVLTVSGVPVQLCLFYYESKIM